MFPHARPSRLPQAAALVVATVTLAQAMADARHAALDRT
jgi:hypothetical protein